MGLGSGSLGLEGASYCKRQTGDQPCGFIDWCKVLSQALRLQEPLQRTRGKDKHVAARRKRRIPAANDVTKLASMIAKERVAANAILRASCPDASSSSWPRWGSSLILGGGGGGAFCGYFFLKDLMTYDITKAFLVQASRATWLC